jgi:Domain of unknown function (DUF4440)
LRRVCTYAVVLGLCCAAAVADGVKGFGAPLGGVDGNASAIDENAALQSDRTFAQAIAKGDAAAAGKFLDEAFTWTDSAGMTLTRAQVLARFPAPAIIDESGTQITQHNYGQVENVQIRKGRDNTLRIWVKRPPGWRLLVYQETRLLDTAPTAAPGTGKTCENPCKTMPYTPKNMKEKEVLQAFMALQTATVRHDSATWGKYVADEFAAANSNSNQVLDKPGRMADLERSKMAGYSPMPVVSMRLYEFGDVFVLVSRHQPEHGQPVHITRLWIKRGGKWQEAASYQTRIEAGASSR